MMLADTGLDVISIAVANPSNPALGRLIGESQQDLLQHFPPDEIFSATQQDLEAPNCHVLLARRGSEPVGCVVLFDNLNYGEVKRLYVRQPCRGMGLARGLMLECEMLAGEIGLRLMRLETGASLKAAVGLYHALGYRECAPFGGYPAAPRSLFLEKRLF